MDTEVAACRSYDHTKKDDLVALTNDLSGLSVGRKSAIIMASVKGGLMGAHVAIRFGLKVTGWRHGDNAAWIYSQKLAQREPATVSDLWDQLTNHIVSGRDTFDKKSAGGMNGEELGLLIKFASSTGWQPPSLEATPETAAPSR